MSITSSGLPPYFPAPLGKPHRDHNPSDDAQRIRPDRDRTQMPHPVVGLGKDANTIPASPLRIATFCARSLGTRWISAPRQPNGFRGTASNPSRSLAQGPQMPRSCRCTALLAACQPAMAQAGRALENAAARPALATLARQKICLSKFSGKGPEGARGFGEQPARLLTHARMSAIAVQVSYPADRATPRGKSDPRRHTGSPADGTARYCWLWVLPPIAARVRRLFWVLERLAPSLGSRWAVEFVVHLRLFSSRVCACRRVSPAGEAGRGFLEGAPSRRRGMGRRDAGIPSARLGRPARAFGGVRQTTCRGGISGHCVRLAEPQRIGSGRARPRAYHCHRVCRRDYGHDRDPWAGTRGGCPLTRSERDDTGGGSGRAGRALGLLSAHGRVWSLS